MGRCRDGNIMGLETAILWDQAICEDFEENTAGAVSMKQALRESDVKARTPEQVYPSLRPQTVIHVRW